KLAHIQLSLGSITRARDTVGLEILVLNQPEIKNGKNTGGLFRPPFASFRSNEKRYRIPLFTRTLFLSLKPLTRGVIQSSWLARNEYFLFPRATIPQNIIAM